MIKISPQIQHTWQCPYCLESNPSSDLIWQGIHVVVKGQCRNCKAEIWSDLPIGHAIYDGYQIDLNNNRLFGSNTLSRSFFGLPLLKTLQKPNLKAVNLNIIKRKSVNQIVLVNCLDYLYGHCLLKLFNVDQHLNKNEDVVVIVPKFLVWAVPKQVAEIWEVDLSLRQMKEYYPDLNMQLGKQLSRFNTVYLSKAFSHPNLVNIENFTAVKPHDFSSNKYRVSFIWREDRPWFFSFPISFLARKYSGMKMLLLWQNWKIRRVFSYLSKNIPEANFTVIGIGKSTNFPDWIQDLRVEKPNQQQEKLLCQAYAESRVVIGVHGSSLLLPSAHAGAVIDLLPDDRLNNFAQDVMYHSVETEADPRLLSFRYRYLPISVSPSTVARQVTSIVKNYQNAKKYFHLGFEKNNH